MNRLLAATLMTAILMSLSACAENPSKSSTTTTTTTTSSKDEYTVNEVIDKAQGFFGQTTEGLARAIQKLFEDLGQPNAIITGEEGGGAVVVGLRYGHGVIETKRGEKREIYWQGPSVGFDVGGNASKVFTLIYHLRNVDQMYQRFPGVDGSLYVVAGLSMNYQRSGDITVAPIRTGVGWRAGANIGYLHYTREKSINPL